MEWAPVVHAVVAAWLGPWTSRQNIGAVDAAKATADFDASNAAEVRVGDAENLTMKPYLMEIWPAPRLMRSLGTKSGDTFL